MDGVEEHLKVQFDQFCLFVHVIGKTQKHDVMDPKQRDQDKGRLGQFPKKEHKRYANKTNQQKISFSFYSNFTIIDITTQTKLHIKLILIEMLYEFSCTITYNISMVILLIMAALIT